MGVFREVCFPFSCQHWFLDFAKILLSLDPSAVDSILLQKFTQALRFGILISFLYRLSFVWYKFQEDSLLLYLAVLK